MLEYLLIQNFQRHSKLRVDFDPHITTIIGSTDAGKSSILRALRWVCLNQPNGDSFIKLDTDGTTVQLFVDGHKIGRKRTKAGDNFYLLDDSPEPYVAFGFDVPQDINQLLNLGPRNFQTQSEPWFWFSQSAGEVSRQLNAVVDLGVIDDSLAFILKKYQAFKAESQVARSRLQQANKRKKELEWVEDADSEYLVIESVEKKLVNKSDEVGRLRDILQGIATAKETREIANTQYTELREVLSLGREVEEIRDKRERLSNLLDEIVELKNTIAVGVPDSSELEELKSLWVSSNDKRTRLGSLLKDIKEARAKIAVGAPDTSELEAMANSYQEVRDKATRLKSLLDSIAGSNGEILILKDENCRIEEELRLKTDGHCPVCGGEFNATAHDHSANTEEWIHAKSSNVSMFKYSKGNLSVKYTSGVSYEYSEVPNEIYQGLLKAVSAGSYLAEHVKGKFKYQKLE